MTSETTMTPEEQAEKLCDVLSLADLFNTCVGMFGLIHPSKALNDQQHLALTRLGIQQGRLLIFGNAVGISSPPATIATSMVPSDADDINPEPTSPIFFDPRDPRLDDPEWRKVVEATLREIVDRPAHLSREKMMELYGLKPPRRAVSAYHPTLDTNRHEAFLEKYSLLHDLSESLGCSRGLYRTPSITSQHWQIHDVELFSAFVSTVRELVDKLVHLFDCKEKVDRGIRSDIKALGWHPEMPTRLIRKDAEKLKLILGACHNDYPAFSPVAEMALDYINQELQEGLGPWPLTVPKLPPENGEKEYKEVNEMQKEIECEKSFVAAGLTPAPLHTTAESPQKMNNEAIIQDIEVDNILLQADALNSRIERFSQFNEIGRAEPQEIQPQIHVM